jgi:GTP-binding protein HflX
LPDGASIILSDTVGFVSNLPTALIAAFRATLEEVTEADLIVHVRDISHPDSDAQAADVAEVLNELGIDLETSEHVIEVWNKIDLLPDRPFADGRKPENVVAVSALTGEGLPSLLDMIEARVTAVSQVFQVELSGQGLAALHQLYELGDVMDRTDTSDGATLVKVRVPEERLDRFRRLFPKARKLD